MTTIALAGCDSKSENPAGNANSKQPTDESITIKDSPDKYTWYIKNYVGKNCASIGYTSMGGDRMDHYGAGYIELVIGTFGKAAYRFADFLHEAGQKYWQLLPLGPTSYGDSPYQAFSAFAGNPYFIDLDTLIADDLLPQTEVGACAWGTEPRYVDYGKIYESRFALLEKAKARGWSRDREAVAAFEAENARWLPDYALFMALKRRFGMKS